MFLANTLVLISHLTNFPDFTKSEITLNHESAALFSKIANLEYDIKRYNKAYGKESHFDQKYVIEEYPEAYTENQKNERSLNTYKILYKEMIDERDQKRLVHSYIKKTYSSIIYTGIPFLLFFLPLGYIILTKHTLVRSPYISACLGAYAASSLVQFRIVFGPPLNCVDLQCLILLAFIFAGATLFSVVIFAVIFFLEKRMQPKTKGGE